MVSYAYGTVLLVPSGSMTSPVSEINYNYNCPDGGFDGHGIQSALYLDPRTGDTFVYCPIHRVIFRIKDNIRIRFKNATWKPTSRENDNIRIPTKSGGTKKTRGSLSWSSIDVD